MHNAMFQSQTENEQIPRFHPKPNGLNTINNVNCGLVSDYSGRRKNENQFNERVVDFPIDSSETHLGKLVIKANQLSRINLFRTKR